MSNPEKKNEDEVFLEEVDDNEVEAAAGGNLFSYPDEENDHNCVNDHFREIYFADGSFPNCAASVEDGSWCSDNDACVGWAVVYYRMKECSNCYR